MNPENIIVAFSFGKKGSGPSESSRAIARYIAFCLDQVGIHAPFTFIIAQWEVGLALKDLGISSEAMFFPKDSTYLSTRDVARSTAELINRKGWQNVRIITAAHPDHIKRALRCMRNCGLINGGVMVDTSLGYDSTSDEWWVRSRLRFIIREFLAAPLYLCRGELF